MSTNKIINKEIKTLDELEKDLYRLLSTIKPSDKLKLWDSFIVEKDILLPGSKEDFIKADNILIIENIIKGGKGKTDKIVFSIEGNEKIYNMSKGVFIVSFCKDITSKEEESSKQIKELRNKIKEEKNKIKNKDISEESEQVKDKVGFLLRIAKMFYKKI